MRYCKWKMSGSGTHLTRHTTWTVFCRSSSNEFCNVPRSENLSIQLTSSLACVFCSSWKRSFIYGSTSFNVWKKKFLRIVYDPSLHYVIIKILSNFFIKNKSQYLLYKENTVHFKAVTSLIFTMQYLVCKIEERELGKHVF